MTPIELDAIFRAWRDEMQAEWPRAKGWKGSIGELRCHLYERVNSWDMTDDVITRAVDIGEAHYEDNLLAVCFPLEQPFLFLDLAPLPASVPIPFPAGKALLAISVSRPEPPLRGKIAEHLAKESPAAAMLKSGIFENKP